ncbi:CidA/LrgA family protein [Liquorilactobacillus mali]|nr:CidA/LrgA family protein [Liquorilactobacillus mali]
MMNSKKNGAPILLQMGIYSAILFVSNIISSLFPASTPVPTPVIGLIILYSLLTFKIIKIEWVESLGAFLISIIGFLFVPSGISLAANLDIMKTAGVQLVLVVFFSTIILLVVTAYTTRFFIFLHTRQERTKQRRVLTKKIYTEKAQLTNGDDRHDNVY